MSFAIASALVTLATPHLELLVQFYQQVLCQEPTPYLPGSYAEFRLPGLTLGLFQPARGGQAEFSQTERATFSLCLEVADLEGAIAHLNSLGYPPPGPILQASHGREIYAFDPEGNRLILHQSPKRASGD